MFKKSEPAFAIGVDYGTNSVRALVVDVAEGGKSRPRYSITPAARPASCSIRAIRTPPGRTRPTILRASIVRSAGGAIRCQRSGVRPERVVGIGVDTTGSTPIPVDRGANRWP